MKKTWFGVVLLPLAVALIAIALVGGETTQARETASPAESNAVSQGTPTHPTRVFECFRVDVADNQPGGDPKAVVRLSTLNFGGKLVRVRKLVAMCELAIKVPPQVPGTPDDTPKPPDADLARIFACYEIQKGNDPNDPYILATNNFGRDFVQVRTSKQMCEEASKTVVTATGETVTVGEPTGEVWQCFNLDRSKNNNLKFRLVTHNFGRDDVTVFRGTQLCEDAVKLRQINGTIVESGHATGKVAECFRIEAKLDPKAKVTLQTSNFGTVDVTVRRAGTMCELAKKTPVLIFPNDPTDPADTE